MLRLSLITCPIALYSTASERARIGFHQFNAKTGNRVRQPKIDEGTGQPVEPDDIVRGYQEGEEPFVEITDEDIAAIAPEFSKTVVIDGFVPREEIDLAYVSRSYHVVPDGPAGVDVHALIRETLASTRTAALARVVMANREQALVLVPRGDGILAVVMHYAYEMNEEVVAHPGETVRIPREMRSLAKSLVAHKMRRFDPTKFRDGYEEALKEMIDRKRRGRPIKARPAKRARPVGDLLEALRRSVRKPSSPSGARRSPKKARGAKTGLRKASPRKSAVSKPSPGQSSSRNAAKGAAKKQPPVRVRR